MILNQNNYNNDLRELFCDAVIRVFGSANTFIVFLENDKYSTQYDCLIDYNSENYIINRKTGEYINWYKFEHLGRCINLSVLCLYDNISKWFVDFLTEFKESGVKE